MRPDDVGHHGETHPQIRRADQAHRARNDKDQRGRQRTCKRDCHQRRCQHNVDGAHAAQQVAMADAVAHHAEHGRYQRAPELHGSEQGQQQHRAGLGQHVPAQDQRLHLEGAGSEQVREPLKTKAAVAEERER
jgi:hypothetical protein